MTDFDMIGCGWGSCSMDPAPGIGICREHAIQAYMWVRETAEMKGLTDAKRILSSSTTPQSKRKRGPMMFTPGLVYALRSGPFIKFGFTTNLKRRLREIEHDEVLGTMPGTMATEKSVHATLRPHRHEGEWFADNDEVRAFIADRMTSGAA